MKRLILILFLPLFLFAQSENQSQSIELPDFVITGKQKVDLPIMKKAKAEPVSILSKEYFFPSFAPEQFSLTTVAKPVQQLADLLPNEKSYNKQLILGAGQYTLPTGKFYFAQPFSVGKFYSKLWGTNQKDYVDYADYNVSGINLGSKFYVSRNSSFLPGAILNIDGKFIRKDYNFYSTYNPLGLTPVKRETQNILGSLSIDNYYGDIFDYRFSISGNNINIKDVDTKETNLRVDGNTKTSIGSFALLLKGNFTHQSLARTNIKDGYSSSNVIGGIELKLSNGLFIRAGVGYFSTDTQKGTNPTQPFIFEKAKDDLVAPWGEIEYSFNSYLNFKASYKPEIEFKNLSDNLQINPYLHLREPSDSSDLGYDNSSSIYNHKANVAFTYGYKKYYEIVVGGEFFKADKYAFFNSDFSSTGLPVHSSSFMIDRVDDVTGYSVYANALYHLGPFGWFYGDAKYQVVNTENNLSGNKVTLPYHPKFSLEMAYGYQFGFGLSTELRLLYLKDTYADIENDILLDDYINLSANLRYSLTDSFDFTLHLNNLLNRNNYFWLGYLEPPFDFTAGIDFRF